jgi:para-nitrobenzyl esterase
MMSSYWVNFAASGDPNGKGLPKWPAYEQRSDLLMEFGDEIAMRRVPHKAQLDFFEAYYNKLRN